MMGVSNSCASFGSDRLQLVSVLEGSHFWFVGRRALVERLLRHRVRAGAATVLDVGCGTGSLTRSLSRQGFRVLGVDLRPEGLQRMRGETPPAWVAQA